MTTGNEQAARFAVRQALLNNGVPGSFVDEITDLAFHAANAATDALKNVVFRVSDDRAMVTTLGVACSLVVNQVGGLLEAQKSLAEKHGQPVHQVHVKVGQ